MGIRMHHLRILNWHPALLKSSAIWSLRPCQLKRRKPFKLFEKHFPRSLRSSLSSKQSQFPHSKPIRQLFPIRLPKTKLQPRHLRTCLLQPKLRKSWKCKTNWRFPWIIPDQQQPRRNNFTNSTAQITYHCWWKTHERNDSDLFWKRRV